MDFAFINMIPINYFLFLGCFVFVVGLVLVLTQKHIIAILMGVELLFNAANINLVAFSRYDTQLNGQVFSLFVLLIAAAETVVGLSIAYQFFKQSHKDQPAQLRELGEKDNLN